MANFITELRERRVIPAIGVYAASSWLIIEILDRLVERYLLSPYLTDMVFWGLFSLIPAVSLIAWSYGRPGKDSATTAQKIGVPINIVLTAGLLLTVFGGKEFGATAAVITVANEDGVEETHIVPKESYRRRLGVFFYENASNDPELDWLQYGATELLTQDLQQDPYLVTSSPYSSWGGGFYARMKAKGFDDALELPVSLMRDIARDANRQYFIEGEIDRQGEEIKLTTRLWDAGSMQQVDEFESVGWDIFSMLDETSREIRKSIEVPSAGIAGYEDLPLAETYGESEQALKSYVSGLNIRLFTNNVATANQMLDEALVEDPDFVLAHFVKAMNFMEAGDLPSAAESVSAVRQLEYRLPARDRATIKLMYYRVTGQNEKLVDFLRLQVQLHDDARSHSRLGNILMLAGETDSAMHHFRAALERDPLNSELLLVLSALERSNGNMPAAIAYAEQYQADRPEDMNANILLGDLLRDAGELEQAEAQYRRASLIESEAVEPLMKLAIIAARRGDEQEARAFLEEADLLAKTDMQRATVHQGASILEYRFGRVRAAIEQIEASEPHLMAVQAPFSVLLSVHVPIAGYYVRINELDAATAKLAEAASLLAPPLDQFLAAGEVTILVGREEFEAAEAALQRFKKVLEDLKFDGMMFQVDLLAAAIADGRGDKAAVAGYLSTAIEAIENSFLAGQFNEYGMVAIQAELAYAQILENELESAEATLESAFKVDPTYPNLWVAKARLQHAKGQSQLAKASISYALAIWENADDQASDVQDAREFAALVNAES